LIDGALAGSPAARDPAALAGNRERLRDDVFDALGRSLATRVDRPAGDRGSEEDLTDVLAEDTMNRAGYCEFADAAFAEF
jgi:hypothetical protein